MQYVQRIKYAMNKVEELISNRVNKKIEKNSINAPLVRTIFELGDVSMEIVKLPDEQLSNKLQFELTGPFKVIKKGKNNKVYYLVDELNELTHPVSVNRLRKWNCREKEEKNYKQDNLTPSVDPSPKSKKMKRFTSKHQSRRKLRSFRRRNHQ